QRIPGRIWGAVLLAGESDPEVVAGAVQSVRRLETAGGDVFFRVRLDAAWLRSRNTEMRRPVITTGVESPSGDPVAVMLGAFTAEPPASHDVDRGSDGMVLELTGAGGSAGEAGQPGQVGGTVGPFTADWTEALTVVSD